MDPYVKILIIVLPLVFLASFMDAIAGGGGIISYPAYLLAGLPVHMAYGCNKFAATVSQVFAVAKYGSAGHIKVKPSLLASVTSLMGAWVGTQILLRIPEEVLKVALMIALPCVAVFLVTRKGFSQTEEVEKNYNRTQLILYPLMIGLGCGFYDGIFGPGTGTFLILAFTAVMGYSLITSSGSAKLVNLASNFGSMIAFLFSRELMWSVAIPAAVASSLGSYIGSRTAIKNGSKIIRPVIMLVLGLLCVRVFYDFFFAG